MNENSNNLRFETFAKWFGTISIVALTIFGYSYVNMTNAENNRSEHISLDENGLNISSNPDSSDATDIVTKD